MVNKIAKRTLLVGKSELENLLGLPEGVEIMEIKHNGNHEDGWDILLVSAGEVTIGETKITIAQDGFGYETRRLSLSELKDSEDDYYDGKGLESLVGIIASLRKDVDKLLEGKNQSISVTINSTEPQSTKEFAEKFVKELKNKSLL